GKRQQEWGTTPGGSPPAHHRLDPYHSWVQAPNDRSREELLMPELLVDFITSLDGYGAAEGWPGWWGLQGPEYLAWLGERPDADYTLLMGANTYRQMYGFASAPASDFTEEERSTIAQLARVPKVVFSSTLDAPLLWANAEL